LRRYSTGAAKVITGCPQILACSVVDKLAPNVKYLEEEVGLGRDGAVKAIIGKAWRIMLATSSSIFYPLASRIMLATSSSIF